MKPAPFINVATQRECVQCAPCAPTVPVPLDALADLLNAYARATAGQEYDRDDLTRHRGDDAYDALCALIALKAVPS